jgi:hypothetical protein
VKSLTGAGISKDAPGKPLVYEALSTLNQNFEKVLLGLERLKDLGLFRDRFPREFLKTCRTTIEEMRAWANLEVIQTLHDREEHDRAHFGGLRHQWEKKYTDPDDVLIKAERRKRQSARKARPP